MTWMDHAVYSWTTELLTSKLKILLLKGNKQKWIIQSLCQLSAPIAIDTFSYLKIHDLTFIVFHFYVSCKWQKPAVPGITIQKLCNRKRVSSTFCLPVAVVLCLDINWIRVITTNTSRRSFSFKFFKVSAFFFLSRRSFFCFCCPWPKTANEVQESDHPTTTASNQNAGISEFHILSRNLSARS